MYRTLLGLVTLVPAVAVAGAPEIDLSWDPTQGRSSLRQDADRPSTVASARGYDMEVGFRGRMLSIPNSIIDIWYFSNADHDDAGVGNVPDRPKIKGYGLGLEFVVKGETANGIFYFDWLNSTLEDGYWDDREGLNAEDYTDGEYLVPTANLGILAFGANYGYEVHFVRTAETNGNFGLSFLVGGGLGVGIMLGHLDVWTSEAGSPSYVRYQDDVPSDGEKAIPKVYPMVDINAGLRFNFGDRVVLRFEGGLHTLIYWGGSLGIMF
jgi:hypothetical protein